MTVGYRRAFAHLKNTILDSRERLNFSSSHSIAGTVAGFAYPPNRQLLFYSIPSISSSSLVTSKPAIRPSYFPPTGQSYYYSPYRLLILNTGELSLGVSETVNFVASGLRPDSAPELPDLVKKYAFQPFHCANESVNLPN